MRNGCWIFRIVKSFIYHGVGLIIAPCIMIRNKMELRESRAKPIFKVQAAWFLHPKFEHFLNQCWTNYRGVGLVSRLSCLWAVLQQWNVGVFGHLFDRKFRWMARLAGVQKALQRQFSVRLDKHKRFKGSCIKRFWFSFISQQQIV